MKLHFHRLVTKGQHEGAYEEIPRASDSPNGAMALQLVVAEANSIRGKGHTVIEKAHCGSWNERPRIRNIWAQ